METVTRTRFFSTSSSSTMPLKPRQRAVHDADRVADLVANDDLALFDAELNDLILRQGRGLVLPDVTNPVTPRTFLTIYQALIRHDHLHQHIAGENLAIIGFRAACP